MTDVIVSNKDVVVEVAQPTIPPAAIPPKIGLVEINQVVQRGSAWMTGHGPPTLAGGQYGDMYLDVDTGDMYLWDGDSWEYQGTFAPSTLTPEEILAALITVDGSGSLLDADTLDTHDSLYFAKQSDMDTQTAKNNAQDSTLSNHELRITGNTTNIADIVTTNTDQTAAITALQTGLATETTNRQNADTTLQTNITSEATTRANADSAEVTARTNADTALDAKITTEKNRNDAQDTAIAARLTDAPNDGKYYGRKSATWAKVTEEAPSDGLGYSRKNGAWVPSSGGAYTDDNPPAGPLQDGQFWWKSSTGVLYLWYDDGNTQQWVQASTSGAVTGNLDLQGYSILGVKQLAVGPTAALVAAAVDTPLLVDGRVSTMNGIYSNAYFDGTNYKAVKAGWAHTFTMNSVDGTSVWGKSTASLAAGGNINFTPLLSFNAANLASFAAGIATGGSISVTGRVDATDNLTANIIQSSSYLASNAAIWCYMSALGAIFGLNRGGGLRLFSWNGTWYWDWNESSGDMRYVQNGNVRTTWRTSDGALIHTVSATYKPGGGPWVDSSDERIKEVDGPYDRGLDQVLALNPVVYRFLGNDTAEEPHNIGTADPEADVATGAPTVPYPNSPHYQPALDGQTFVGLIAQEVEQVFPGMVTKRAGYIDGQPVDDIRDLDTTTLIFALVNSIKTLNERIAALEAR